MNHPLSGQRIVITRPPHKAHTFADQLRALGAEPILLPMIEIRPLDDPSALDQALQESYDWVIFTSANTVDQIWARLKPLSASGDKQGSLLSGFGVGLNRAKIAVVGKATAQALRESGLEPDLIPEKHVAEALYKALAESVDLKNQRIFLPQSSIAREVLGDLLRSAGALVTQIDAYHTIQPQINPAMLAGSFDVITFTSSSTVRHFCELFDDPLQVIGGATVACIGPITAQTARDLGLPVHIVPENHTVEGLIESIVENLTPRPLRVSKNWRGGRMQ